MIADRDAERGELLASELNEAVAAVGVASARDLGLPMDIVNGKAARSHSAAPSA